MALNTKVPKEVPPNQSYELPKLNGGDRQLGIPTVMDRMIQQAIVQVISPICEPHFSETSYGFKPERSCEKAIIKLLKYLNDGYEWIVAIDLEKFFDTVPQDRLMSLVHNMIQDDNTESLIRKYLHSGVVVNGHRQKTLVGTPQGGNLSRSCLISCLMSWIKSWKVGDFTSFATQMTVLSQSAVEQPRSGSCTQLAVS